MNALTDRQAWLFSIKTYLAAVAALYIAMAGNLSRPYWAMGTVYIVSQPLLGPTRAKGVYRIVGTLVAGLATLLVLPALVETPLVLSAAMSIWLAGCLFMALLNRGPRGYAFLLAGYTTAFIGFPAVTSPETIFDTVVARSEEIILGTVVAVLFASLLFPASVRPMLRARIGNWMEDAAQWCRQIPERGRAHAPRNRLAADLVQFEALIEFLRRDDPRHAGSAVSMERLRERMLLLLPVLSSIADRLSALRSDGGVAGRPAGTDRRHPRLARRADQCQRVRPPARTHQCAEAAGGPRPAAPAAGQPAAAPGRTGGPVAGLPHPAARHRPRHRAAGPRALPHPHRTRGRRQARRLRHGAVLRAQCRRGADELLRAVDRAGMGRRRQRRDDGRGDRRVLRRTGRSGTEHGVVLVWAMVASVVAGVYLFGVFPAVHDFGLLALVLAVAFLPLGLMLHHPKSALFALPLTVNLAALLSLQNTYSANIQTFLNSSIAMFIGIGFAVVMTRLFRSVGAEWTARRLVRQGWTTLAEAAEGRGQQDRQRFAARMLDLLGLLAPAAATPEGSDIASVDMLNEARIGLNILQLRRARLELPERSREAVEHILEEIAVHYRRQIAARKPIVAADALRERLDTSLGRVGSVAACKARDEALMGLIGLRFALFPEAKALAPGWVGAESPSV